MSARELAPQPLRHRVRLGEAAWSKYDTRYVTGREAQIARREARTAGRAVPHSTRRASMGSRCEARVAGIHVATSATPVKMTGTAMNTVGS